MLSTNQKLREGIFTALDPQAIIDGVLNGKGSATHDYANDLYPEYNKKWDSEDYYNYDEAKAKQLIQESGYNGEELTLVTYNMSPYKEMAEVIQAYLQQVGVNVKIYPIEQTQRDNVFAATDSWDMFLITTLSMDYIVNCYTYLLDANNWNGATITHYKDSKFQSLLEASTAVDTHSQETVDAVHDYMVEQAFARGLVVNNFYSIWKEGVTGIYTTHNGYVQPTSCIYSESWKSVAD